MVNSVKYILFAILIIIITPTTFGSSKSFQMGEELNMSGKSKQFEEEGSFKSSDSFESGIESVFYRPRRVSTSSTPNLVDLVRRTNTPAEQSETVNQIIRSRSSTVIVKPDNEAFVLAETCAKELFSSESYSFECAWEAYEQDTEFLLKLLRSEEFDVNESVFYTSTPLIEAIRSGRKELVQILIDRPDTDFNNYGYFGMLPLELSLTNDSIFELLMESKTNLNVLSENAYHENVIEVALTYEMYAKAEVMLKRVVEESRSVPLKMELKNLIRNASRHLSITYFDKIE